MDQFTPTTPVKLEKIKGLIENARRTGFAVADQTYESDVYGIAAPIFGADGFAQGAVAVATPAHRMTKEIRKRTACHVIEASVRITRKLGFEPPASFLGLQQRTAA
jgi:DNA-binding IclR family transcriptional regulator